MCTKVLAWSLLGAMSLASAAWAQSSSVEEVIVTAQQKQKQVVSNGVIGVLGAKSALETPFNVTTYTAQLVLDQQSETLGKVMENEPSVRTTYGSGNQSEMFVIRGFPLNGDDVSIDGLYGVTPRQLVSPELYESIQVLNGASAFLFGAAPSGSSIGGGINLTPKRAEKTLRRATLSYSADSLFGANTDLGGRFGADKAFGVRVNGVYREGDTAVDKDHRKVAVLGVSGDYRRDRLRASIDLAYEDQEADHTRPIVRLAAGQAVPTAPKASANYGQAWTFTVLKDFYGLARVDYDLSDNLTAYVSGGFRDGSEKGDYSTLTVTNSAMGAGTGARLYVPREDNNQALQAGVRGKAVTGGFTHEFNAGGSLVETENRNAFTSGLFPVGIGVPTGRTTFFSNLYNTPVVDRPTNSTLPASGGDLSNPPKVSEGEFKSLFVSDTLGAFSDKLLVTLGARRQTIIIDSYNRGTGARTAHYDRTTTTPAVGIAYRPTQTLSFYANRIESLAQGPTAPLTANLLNPGEVFPPFKSVQYEIGAKLAVKGLTGTVALYQIKQPSTFTAATPTTANPAALTFVVDGEQRNRGLEISLNGEPTDWLRFIGGLTVTNAKLTQTLNGANNGKTAIGVPDYQANLGVEVVPSFLKAATLTGRIVQTDSQYVDVANTQRVKSWTRLDLGVRYVLVANEKPVTLRLSAENVANRRYWYSAFGGYLLQGQPRTVKASVTYEF